MDSAERGMTLIEIMISVSILSVAMLASLMAVVQGTQMVQRSREENIALQMAERRMAELQALSFSGIQQLPAFDEFVPSVQSGAGFTLEPHVGTEGELPMGTVTITQAGGLMSVTVTVQWRGDTPAHPRQISVATKVAP